MTHAAKLKFVSKLTEDVLKPLRPSFNLIVRVCVLAEVDDLAVYLDQLLAVPQQCPISTTKGGLSRFRAAARKTREMVSLVHKARELNIHSEFANKPAVVFHAIQRIYSSIYFDLFADVHMYLPTKLFRSPAPNLNLLDNKEKVDNMKLPAFAVIVGATIRIITWLSLLSINVCLVFFYLMRFLCIYTVTVFTDYAQTIHQDT